ncbi:hypothetical protein QOT17_014131 [Balamuthia mandrillaris]
MMFAPRGCVIYFRHVLLWLVWLVLVAAALPASGSASSNRLFAFQQTAYPLSSSSSSSSTSSSVFAVVSLPRLNPEYSNNLLLSLINWKDATLSVHVVHITRDGSVVPGPTLLSPSFPSDDDDEDFSYFGFSMACLSSSPSSSPPSSVSAKETRVAIGSPLENGQKGVVYLVDLDEHGKVREWKRISAPTAGALHFGMSVCVLPDLDGDSIPDIAIGAHDNVFLFTLNADGTVKETHGQISASSLPNAPTTTNNEFGRSISSSGFFLQDGVTIDLLIGSPGEDEYTGAMHAIQWNVTSRTVSQHKRTSGQSLSFGAGARFGHALSYLGRLHRDDQDQESIDVLISAPTSNSSSYSSLEKLRGQLVILHLNRSRETSKTQPPAVIPSNATTSSLFSTANKGLLDALSSLAKTSHVSHNSSALLPWLPTKQRATENNSLSYFAFGWCISPLDDYSRGVIVGSDANVLHSLFFLHHTSFLTADRYPPRSSSDLFPPSNKAAPLLITFFQDTASFAMIPIETRGRLRSDLSLVFWMVSIQDREVDDDGMIFFHHRSQFQAVFPPSSSSSDQLQEMWWRLQKEEAGTKDTWLEWRFVVDEGGEDNNQNIVRWSFNISSWRGHVAAFSSLDFAMELVTATNNPFLSASRLLSPEDEERDKEDEIQLLVTSNKTSAELSLWSSAVVDGTEHSGGMAYSMSLPFSSGEETNNNMHLTLHFPSFQQHLSYDLVSTGVRVAPAQNGDDDEEETLSGLWALLTFGFVIAVACGLLTLLKCVESK